MPTTNDRAKAYTVDADYAGENAAHLASIGGSLAAGAIVYRFVGPSYGMADDDSIATGERFIACTFNPTGMRDDADGKIVPFFTVPLRLLTPLPV